MNAVPVFDRRRALAATLLLPCVACAREDGKPAPALDVHYVPTPMPVVDKMLEMAQVRRGETLFDLGCGDGRIVVAAARRHGARGIGIDLDPVRIDEARANARYAGVQKLVEFRVANLFDTDLRSADIVTLYLLPLLNQRLRPKLWQQLRVGSRVVSHSFDMGAEWPPERTERVNGAVVHGWTITAQNKAA